MVKKDVDVPKNVPAPKSKDWRLSIDLIDSSDVILSFATVDEAVEHVKQCFTRGYAVEEDQAKNVLWLYPMSQVRSFNIYKRG